MIKINKNLLKFTIIGAVLSSIVVAVFSKFLPLFLLHSVYFCQQFINSFSIKIPHELGYVLLGLLMTMVLVGAYNLLSIFFQVRQLRKHLIAFKQSGHTLYTLFKKLHLQRNVAVIESEKPFAFCIGIRHQKIYISTKLIKIMNRKELEAVLLHERYHMENRDSLILLLGSILKLLFPFFPVVSDLLTQYKINREIEADQAAVRMLGNSRHVISVLRKFVIYPSPSFANATAIADYITLEPRIKALLEESKNFRKFRISNILISFLSIILFATFVITPVHAVAMHMPDDTTMLCLSDDACARWCKEHNTVVPYSKNSQSPVNASHMYSSTK